MKMANEKRLIDANVFNHAYEFVKKHMVAGDSEFLQGFEAGLLGAYNAVNQIDTVDAVEVVRCKDCKHRGDYNCPMYYDEYIEDDYDGYHDSTWIDHDRTADDGFCDRGERKDNAD